MTWRSLAGQGLDDVLTGCEARPNDDRHWHHARDCFIRRSSKAEIKAGMAPIRFRCAEHVKT